MRMSSLSASNSSVSRAVKIVEGGGKGGVCNIERVVSPILGRQARNAAITEVQKRMGSLSSSSRDSQAKDGLASRGIPSPACGLKNAAAHVESRVVLPLPAEAEMSVKGWERTASNSLSKRERSTREAGRRGGESLVESNMPICLS